MARLVGYVRLYRKSRDNPLWTQLSPAVWKFFSFVIMEANWGTATWYDGNGEIPVPVGSFVSSFREMARSCCLTLKQVRDSIEDLEKLGVATFTTVRSHDRAHERTMVSVVNYKKYQQLTLDYEDEDDEAGHATGHTLGTRRAREGHTNEIEPLEIAANSNGISNSSGSDVRALKEEEVNKGKRKEGSGAQTVRAPEWERDLSYQPFVEAYRSTRKPLIDNDFADAHYQWKNLDPDGKAKAVESIYERLRIGFWSDPALIMNPGKYLRTREFNRSIEPPKAYEEKRIKPQTATDRARAAVAQKHGGVKNG